ncbi:Uu.00g117810.m01.CDS01 [Anthostomella pinea]|uniref:Uu.00g117810.m01.CDS01 n=1 Tax=Anthostomella pinea TaxID=933095 RepID=A0AAI8VB25_9PEZI|nr:Uu.00g117810.m01.CDS01 [Anthostomella pinea]
MACNGLHPRVGIFAIISDEQGRVLLGQRLSPLGRGYSGFPGGHLEQGEDFFACVERETLEETGLVIRGLKIVGLTNDKFPESGNHYVTVFIKCERKDSTLQPQRLEPEKCEGWSWKSWQEVKAMANEDTGPDKLFLPVQNLVRENPQIDRLVQSE